MRGALLSPIPRVGGGRIIPAYAGSTSTPPSPPCRPRDHPRVCGEHRRLKKLLATLAGSSPRMRGAPSGATSCTSLLRIIPAYAGSTTSDGATVGPTEDHPRVCGEHARHRRHRRQCLGSSPRMRGAPKLMDGRKKSTRIIPAYAGSTPCGKCGYMANSDHPRVCGEHLMDEVALMPRSGSSPRMRGAQWHILYRFLHIGIIPAYAGSTMREFDESIYGRDHPRVCGEHYPPLGRFCFGSESSPRMRGAPAKGRAKALHCGIIPAYAGSTFGRGMAIPDSQDHPRVCGEHDSSAVDGVVPLGSSPRMRGAQPYKYLGEARRRIIPAYAGSTFDDWMVKYSREDHPRVCGEHQCG